MLVEWQKKVDLGVKYELKKKRFRHINISFRLVHNLEGVVAFYPGLNLRIKIMQTCIHSFSYLYTHIRKCIKFIFVHNVSASQGQQLFLFVYFVNVSKCLEQCLAYNKYSFYNHHKNNKSLRG